MKTLRELLEKHIYVIKCNSGSESFKAFDVFVSCYSNKAVFREELISRIEEVFEEYLRQGLSKFEAEPDAHFTRKYIAHLEAQVALLSRDTGYLEGYQAGYRDGAKPKQILEEIS